LTVPEAAHALSISPEAVRNRLSRGTLRRVKEGGTVYVLLETDRTRHTDDIPSDMPSDIPSDMPQAFIGELRGRIESLERQLEQANERDRENRRIIAALTSRIPAIESPQEPTEAPETVEGSEPRSGAPSPQEAVQRRPWWRRVFGS
jgi:hypothetical protein